jgi:AcrR family transcriptional regulator
VTTGSAGRASGPKRAPAKATKPAARKTTAKGAGATHSAAGPVRGGAPAQERELRAQGRKTMRKLLDAGMTVFERRGYHAARVDDIVKVAKTSHGTFYLYFANKEDLFHALAADVADSMRELATELGPVTPDEDGYAEVRDWLAKFTDLYFSYGAVIRVWTEAEVVENDLGAIGLETLRAFTENIARRVADANPDVDPAIAALALLAMIERFNYLVLARQVSFDREAMLDTIATVVHAGMFGGRRQQGARLRRA